MKFLVAGEQNEKKSKEPRVYMPFRPLKNTLTDQRTFGYTINFYALKNFPLKLLQTTYVKLIIFCSQSISLLYNEI